MDNIFKQMVERTQILHDLIKNQATQYDDDQSNEPNMIESYLKKPKDPNDLTEIDISRQKQFDLLDKLKRNREEQMVNYKVLGGVGFQGKYYLDKKDG